MFQFRRFPTYAYLIQRTLHGYCPCGLPHSEIRGSRDICSSPRLIAACHVLRRLLMPRHSPCALFSLTWLVAKSIPLRFRLQPTADAENCAPFPCSSPPTRTRLRWTPSWFYGGRDWTSRRHVRENGSLKNYAGFTDCSKL